MVIGAHGSGVATQSGGTLQVNGTLFLGDYSDNATAGTGTFTQSAGTDTVTTAVSFNGGGLNLGVYNLNGGTLITPLINQGAGTGSGTFNFNGGTLQPSASTLTLMQGLTAANVQAGGAIINTNNFSVTIGQSLIHGLEVRRHARRRFDEESRGNADDRRTSTYTGGTAINVGTLRLGDPNAVQNSTVSVNLNNGLTFATGIDAPNLGGLSGTGNMVLQDASTTAVTPVIGGKNATTAYSGILSGTGGVTKAGTGGLVLSGANTYTGPTTVNAGTLTLSGSAAAGTLTTSGITVNGGSFAFTPTVASTLAMGGSSTLTLNGGNLNFDIDTSSVHSQRSDHDGNIVDHGQQQHLLQHDRHRH